MKKLFLSLGILVCGSYAYGWGDFEPVWTSTTLGVVNSTYSAMVDSHTVVIDYVNVLKIGSFDATLTIYNSRYSTAVYAGTPYVLDMSSSAVGQYNLKLELSSGCYIANRGAVPGSFHMRYRKR